MGSVAVVSAALLISGMSSWLRENPAQHSDHRRVEQLDVAEVLRESSLGDTDLSDAGLVSAASLFPRSQQVSLFRFFCDVRAWTMTRPQLFEAIERADVAVPAPQAPALAAATSPVLTAPATPATTSPFATAAAKPAPAPAAPADAAPQPVTHARLRCPHSAAALAAMSGQRAEIAPFEFDLLVDTSWEHALGVLRDVSRVAGDPAWTVEEGALNDQARLVYRTAPTATPSIEAVVAYRRRGDRNMISFRVIDIRSSTLRSLLGRRDVARPARVLARRLAWGFLPNGQA